ncbi:MAG: thioredoxin domain-containing protein [Inquilinaceae bacterium]
MTSNRLAGEISPYLLQHADNPVDWMPWGPDALARAESEDKPILLSVGYAACHWCHVMAHESFENPDIARVMNDLFVNIKVDREERPDIDLIYQAALAMLGQQGGWPLTMFLTPGGQPFWGGTYFPPEPRYGRPGFPQVLQAVDATYRREPDKIAQNVEALQQALDRTAAAQPPEPLSPALLDQAAEALLGQMDPVHGGFGDAPKFPQPAVLAMLWRAHRRTGRAAFGNAVRHTLTAMCQGGIYDHLGGGFSRYTVDAAWLVPHFEKMLYDNAQLVSILTQCWQATGDPLYARRVEETVDWVRREMSVGGGGFAASLDADSEGEEGRYYVWRASEIEALLGQDAGFFMDVYDVTPGGNWEGKTILNRRSRESLPEPDIETRLAPLRARLLDTRTRRVPPARDDKVLADWNGLMIASLADAGLAFGRADWIALARTAFDFVCEALGDGDRLHHSWRAGTARHTGILDDYAALSDAALRLYEATGDMALLGRAERWTGVLDTHFWDSDAGGYFLTADDAEALIVRSKHAQDNAVPSGNGVVLGVLARLFHLTGEDRYRQRAEVVIAAFSGTLRRNVFAMATFLNNAELLIQATQIVVVGRRQDADAAALIDTITQRSLPNRLLTVVDPDDRLPSGHPAAGKGQVDGRATAYVCQGMRCAAPVTDPAALATALEAT